MLFLPDIFLIRATIIKLLYSFLTTCFKQGNISLNERGKHLKIKLFSAKVTNVNHILPCRLGKKKMPITYTKVKCKHAVSFYVSNNKKGPPQGLASKLVFRKRRLSTDRLSSSSESSISLKSLPGPPAEHTAPELP